MNPDDPVFQAFIAPFSVAFAITAVSRVIGGRFAVLLAGLGVVVAALAGYVLLEGAPAWPAATAKQKLFVLTALGAALGLLLDARGRPRALERSTIVLFPAACLLWLDWRNIAGGPDAMRILTLLLLWLGSVAALSQFARLSAGSASAVSAGILLAAAAVGVLVVADIGVVAALMGDAVMADAGASISLALLAAAVAAAVGGFAVWWFAATVLADRRDQAGATLVFGAGGAMLLIADILVLFTPKASWLALLPLLLVPVVDLAARNLRLGQGRAAQIAEPVILAALAAVPVLAAAGLSFMAARSAAVSGY